MWEQGCKFIQDSFLIARFQYKEFRYSEVRLYSRGGRGGGVLFAVWGSDMRQARARHLEPFPWLTGKEKRKKERKSSNDGQPQQNR